MAYVGIRRGSVSGVGAPDDFNFYKQMNGMALVERDQFRRLSSLELKHEAASTRPLGYQEIRDAANAAIKAPKRRRRKAGEKPPGKCTVPKIPSAVSPEKRKMLQQRRALNDFFSGNDNGFSASSLQSLDTLSVRSSSKTKSRSSVGSAKQKKKADKWKAERVGEECGTPLLEQTWWKAAAKEAARPPQRTRQQRQKLAKSASSLPPLEGRERQNTEAQGGQSSLARAYAEELLEPPEL
jgi:hypothetical protein